jgi:hypothetical protein
MKLKNACALVLGLTSSLASAQQYKLNFDVAGDRSKEILCVPVLTKMYLLLSVGMVTRKAQGDDVGPAHKVAMNVGVRAAYFQRVAAWRAPTDLKTAWTLSALKYPEMQSDYSKMTGVCVQLFNDLNKRGEIDQADLKAAVDKVANELATDLAKK